MKKLSLPPWFSSVGVWIVPFVSVTTLSLFFNGWQQGDRQPSSQSSIPPLPPPSQLTPTAPNSLLSPPQSLIPPGGTIPDLPTRPSPQPQTKPQVSKPKTKTASRPAAPRPQTAPTAPASKSSPTTGHPLAAPINYTPPPLEIRVAILRDEPGTTIGTSQQAILRDRNGKLLKTVAGGRGLWVQPQDNALIIEGQSHPGVVWLQPTESSLVSVGDRWYRGKVLIASQGSSLIVVNYVSLEQYLYSVVGSEMHADAPTEALKAQAIAARSYALVHMIRPASDWFDLGNNQRWQVYKGIQSEYNTTQQAVNATAGQILSHSGGVVESLYAATDEIVARAHGGRGMSQTGAYELARQGYDYSRILSRYYPEVGLARVVLKQ